ncbi:hypothetical protein [Streptomyces sp. MMBL 11-1]|uniref:hypothetical protein n=1 Tax=Streptomyces sp. MMBL 11-1 TaxID=3026420 RepID=UPI0023621D87|nr:hypothetical protein [Streptomyces sp. MMBL 11-1]
MISARLRYTGILCVAVGSFAASIYCCVAGLWTGWIAFWLLSNVCVVVCGRIQTTAARLQEAHHAAQVLARQAELLDAAHCGEQKPPFSEHTLRTECVLRPGHPGSHADEQGTRWWWIDEDLPARAQQR